MKNSNIQSCCHPSGPLRDPSSSGAPSSSISWNLLFSKACHSKDKRRQLSTVHHHRHNHYPSSTTSPTIWSIKLFIMHSYLVVVSSHIKHSYRISTSKHQPSTIWPACFAGLNFWRIGSMASGPQWDDIRFGGDKTWWSFIWTFFFLGKSLVDVVFWLKKKTSNMFFLDMQILCALPWAP